ncbi:DUF4241 domain-containing protein [Streptomyces sp. NPDC006430]|uniref:DUF4241 domain-containing protein n=1 Tax=Streptomyces sp. NPDC006430 TaxID=3154299 RepID=UPI0033B9E79E
MPMTAPDYSWHFTPGNTFSYEEGPTGVLSVADGGELWLPTGRVVACDPFVYLGGGDTAPFTAEVAPGRYRVEVAVATLTQPEEEPEEQSAATPHRRVAAARLVVSDDAPTVSWELALKDGQDPAALGEGEFYGYGVDAGTGCFYDLAADGAFPDCEGDEGPLWEAFEGAGHAAGAYRVEGEGGHSLVAFSSGWGDGAYPTWVGRDAEGAITCFVTDFFVVPTPEETAA